MRSKRKGSSFLRGNHLCGVATQRTDLAVRLVKEASPGLRCNGLRPPLSGSVHRQDQITGMSCIELIKNRQLRGNVCAVRNFSRYWIWIGGQKISLKSLSTAECLVRSEDHLALIVLRSAILREFVNSRCVGVGGIWKQSCRRIFPGQVKLDTAEYKRNASIYILS